MVAQRCSSILPVRTIEFDLMKDETKIKEQFHYFNIRSEIDSVFGNWAVSKDGDVVNCLYPYAILSIHLKDVDWLQIIRGKVWFKPECENALRQAIERANIIIKR